MRNATNCGIPAQLLSLAGQAALTGWSVRDPLRAGGWPDHDDWLVQERHLTIQRIAELVDSFGTWQHQPRTGRRRTTFKTITLRNTLASAELLVLVLAGS